MSAYPTLPKVFRPVTRNLKHTYFLFGLSLSVGSVWLESSLSIWRKLESLVTLWAHSKDSD